jgi:hypothetical protein
MCTWTSHTHTHTCAHFIFPSVLQCLLVLFCSVMHSWAASVLFFLGLWCNGNRTWKHTKRMQ